MTSSDPAPIRVLYVEDDENLQYTLSRMLQHFGYEIETASNGKEGVEKAEQWQPDVILMDIRMPVMDGIEAIKVLRANPKTAAIPIFMLSAYTDAKTRRACQDADAFFSKPPNIERIDAKIRKTLNKEAA